MGKVMYMRKGETHTVPSAGILASDIAVGSTVKLMENGSPVEYLVVNQGVPSGSNLYDSSCNGTWLLRKDVFTISGWSSNNNSYKDSYIHGWLKNDFIGVFDSTTQDIIQQVKIPYVNGVAGSAVANDLSTKIFLLCGYELGWNSVSSPYFPEDGACLDYFAGTTTKDSKRIAYFNSTATGWWTRSPSTYNAILVWYPSAGGDCYDDRMDVSHGVRPALVLSSNALFDKNTLTLKGVS